MATRLEYAAEILQQGSACSEQAHENVLTGIAQQQKRVRWVALFHLAPRYWQPWYAHAVLQSYGVLLAAYRWAQSQPQPTEHTHRLAQSCRQAAQQLRQQQRPHQLGLTELGPFASAHLNTVSNLLQQLADTASPERIPKDKTSFFVADAFSNPAYVRIALQTTLAALLCYLFYSAAQWDGIHTALITCYIVGLSNTGETLHKMLLRIIGCLIGVAITVVYWYVFIPHITSIGALMLAVFLVCLLAAWVVLGSERISYAGLQIAFAFLLINLTAGGPSVDMDMARDRIIGILLGNIMMYGFFTYLWPNSIMQFVQKNLNQANEALQQQDQAPTLTAAIWHAANAAQALETARYQLDLAHLEPKSLRATPEELQAQRAQWQATQHRLFS
nr:FUSC family protein [Paenalcaligenes hominis]